MDYSISAGFSDADRDRVAALYWAAFAAKLNVVMGPKQKALKFISKNLNPRFGLTARAADGRILGVAGFKTSEGALIEGNLRALAANYGWLSTLYRAPLLSLVERDLEDDVLLMDGICVHQDARGMGLGTALLRAIKDEAAARDLSFVRLDVIDSNPRARALYEREGFREEGKETLGPLRWIFGFRSSTKMRFSLPK